MSAAPITLPTAPVAPAATPRVRHLRVMTEADATLAAAEHASARRASARRHVVARRDVVARRHVVDRAASVRMQEAPLVLTARGRLALRILAGFAAAALAILAGAVLGLLMRSTPVAGDSITVGSGDTLWSIAGAVAGGDVRETVAQIVSLNGLAGSAIQPGQVLVLPAPE